jgi:hypothetical protein
MKVAHCVKIIDQVTAAQRARRWEKRSWGLAKVLPHRFAPTTDRIVGATQSVATLAMQNGHVSDCLARILAAQRARRWEKSSWGLANSKPHRFAPTIRFDLAGSGRGVLCLAVPIRWTPILARLLGYHPDRQVPRHRHPPARNDQATHLLPGAIAEKGNQERPSLSSTTPSRQT